MKQRLYLALGVGLLSWGCHAPATSPKDGSPPATASNTSVANTACGEASQPECPTQHWMKSTLQAYLRTKDYKRLESSFKELASHTPGGYEHWGDMAETGARGAAQGDEAAVRKSCQDCHDTYRSSFRQQYRGVQLL
jgi:hypothetical protein